MGPRTSSRSITTSYRINALRYVGPGQVTSPLTLSQEFARQAEDEVVSTSISLENILTRYLGSTLEKTTDRKPKIRSFHRRSWSRDHTDVAPRLRPQGGHGRTPKAGTTFRRSIFSHVYCPPGQGHHPYPALFITGFRHILPAIGPLPCARLGPENLTGNQSLSPGFNAPHSRINQPRVSSTKINAPTTSDVY